LRVPLKNNTEKKQNGGIMKRLTYTLVLIVSLLALASGQTFPSYYSTSDLSLASPGALKFGLYGFDNPALLNYVRQSDVQFTWTDASRRWNDFNRWGLFTAVPNFGFGLVKTKVGSYSITDYRLSLGFGDRTLGFGIGYGFVGGDKAAFDRRNTLTLGALIRPDPVLSIGLIGTATTSGGKSEGVVDLGIRPLRNEMLTLFVDYGIRDDQTLKRGNWSYGVAVEALPGVRVTGRYFDVHTFAVGLSLSLGNAGLSGQSSFDKDAKHSFNTYAIRLGALDRTILSSFMKDSRNVEMDFNGRMKYQRFMFFDKTSTLSSTLDAIKAAKEDETVAGIAINTSGMNVNREMLWEVREQLKDFKSKAKKVVIFIDNASIEEYEFASVADKIVLDPAGTVMLPGYTMGNTYFKGTLEKLGIGYDELRFFKYKSAVEIFSRDRMSDADREQRQKYIDDVFGVAEKEICEGRGFSSEKFEELVNNEVLFIPADAIAKGLVDTLGRWDDAKDLLGRIEGEKKQFKGTGSIAAFNLPYDNRWSEPPRIAVIYALGRCAMDEGIKARQLVKVVEAAGEDPKIKAIVLRVESPGGDGMASDYIAEAMKKAKKNKPVIVSQGYVAGSGGYWLSMYADTIVAAPGTITGSIGVIGGWMYDKGLKDNLGMSTDHVKAGAHADLGFGFTLPFVGLGVPDRNLTAEERARIEYAMRAFYKQFVGKVAEGRKTSPEKIEEIAQGHFYSGLDGKKLNLVDVLGGLEDAIRIARQRAGIRPDELVTIVELPKPGLMDFSSFAPRLIGVQQAISEDPTIEQLKFRLQHNGQPIPLLPLDQIQLDAPNE
jgi:protease-4